MADGGAHGGRGGGGGTHCGAYIGAYGGGGFHHGGGGGGGLHSLVDSMCDQLGTHCAELTPGVATVTAAIGTNATATSAARRRMDIVIAGPPQKDPSRPWLCFSLCPRHTTTTDEDITAKRNASDLLGANRLGGVGAAPAPVLSVTGAGAG